MDESNPVLNDEIVQTLSVAISRGGASLNNVPGLLRRVIDDEMWRRRVVQKTGEIAEFDQFLDFIAAPPLEGLGTSLNTLKQLVAHDKEIAGKLDKVVNDLLPPLAKHGGARDKEQVGVTNLKPSKNNDKEYIIRRLKRDRPDLAERVSHEELSAHAAGIEAGILPKRARLPVDNMADLAQALKRRFDKRELAELVERLQEVEHGHL